MHGVTKTASALFLGLAWLPGPSLAKQRDANTTQSAQMPAILQDLHDCRQVADSAARLACYDRTAEQLVSANKSGDVVIVEREQLRKTEQALFGYPVDVDRVIGSASPSAKPQRVTDVTARIVSVKALPHGEWLFTIEGGAIWQSIETRTLLDEPEKGVTVNIKRGPLGGFQAKFNGGPPVRVRRVG